MSKILSFATVFSVLFIFCFAQELKINAQQKKAAVDDSKCPKNENLRSTPELVSSETDLDQVLCFYFEAMSKNPQEIETARRIRNGVASYVRGMIDNGYDKYADNLYKNRDRQSIKGSVLDYVKGIGTPTKPDLITDTNCPNKKPGACFLSSITSDLTNKKPSKELTVEILLLAMEIARTRAALEMKENMKLDVINYSLESVRRDLRKYYFAGTPIGAARALGEILKEAEQ